VVGASAGGWNASADAAVTAFTLRVRSPKPEETGERPAAQPGHHGATGEPIEAKVVPGDPHAVAVE
jgi:hypothetical protein